MYQAVLQRNANETRYSRLTFIMEPTENKVQLLETLYPLKWHGDVTIYDLSNGEVFATLPESGYESRKRFPMRDSDFQ